MEAINEFFTSFSSFLWGWPMIILLLGTHIFLTVRLRFPQRKIFQAISLSFKKDKNATGDVSQFGALATALAATIGTGNIIGVATAIALGGPGAVFWCWLTGVFGISTKYAEGLLAVKYRVKTKRGEMLGGPMYALEKGLGWKWLGILFALFAALASFGIGSTVQANAISTLVENQYGISPYITGAIVTLLGAAVIIGGVQSISKVCGMLVPFMAIFYVVGCIYILIVNHAYLLPALKVIFESAFTTRAAGGGFAGSTLMIAARYGIARGLFSNESGLGSAPIVAAAAQTRNPVRQALVSSTGTFWDTVIICALTGLVITSSIIAYPDIDYHNGAALTKAAFSKIPYIGAPLLTIRPHHLRLQHHPGMELLWRTLRRVSQGKALDAHLSHALYCQYLPGQCHQPRTGMEYRRLHECPDGDTKPHLPALPQRHHRSRNPQVSLARPARQGDERR